MKLVHTPLGTLVSKKKFIASVAALALVGGIAPALINNTYADGEGVVIKPVVDPTSTDENAGTIYAAVGPYYYTDTYFNSNGDLNITYYSQGYELHITDTDIADFYTSDRDPNCNGEYKCIQGKKIGTTEIIAEKSGEDTVRIPLVSVELTPGAYAFGELGKVNTVTGSIEGADNSLLTIRDEPSGDGNVTITQIGPRSVSIDATNASYWNSVDLKWAIGEQWVYGGTYYLLDPLEGVDNIYHLSENEEALKKAVEDLFAAEYATHTDEPPMPNSVFTTQSGSIFRVTMDYSDMPEDVYERYEKTQGVLGYSDEELTDKEKELLAAELPEGVDGISFKNLEVFVRRCLRKSSGGGGGNAAFYASADGNTESDDYDYLVGGYFEYLSSPLTMAIDVSDVEAVADGYTRKWYVVRDNDGTIEKLEATYDEDTKTIRFDTKVFGLHAYGYVDEEKTEEPVEEGGSEAPKVPNTGSPIQKVAQTAAITFAPLAAIVLGAFMIRNKKKASNKLTKKHNHFE